MRLVRDSGSSGSRVALAAGSGAVLAVLAVLANLGRAAETSAAGSMPALAGFGPGKLGQLRAQQADVTGQPPEGIDAIGRAVLASSPLAYEPFYAAAAAGFRGKTAVGSDQDAVLLREALRRNLRSRESRLLLLRYAVGTGNLKEAIAQIAVMNRLSSTLTETLMMGVGSAINSDRQADDAVAALTPHPELFEPFLRGFVAAKKPAPLAVRLVSRMPRTSFADPQVRGLATNLLVGAQAFAEARALWSTGGSAQGGAAELVHSPDFTDMRVPPPFNWELKVNSTGAAERAPGGGLSLDYYGRTPGAMVTQVLTLSPGAYRARLEYRTLSGSPGALALRLECVGAEVALFEMPLAGASGASQVLNIRFAIPDGACKGQRLSLGGRIQENRNAQQAMVRRLDITPGAGK